MPNLAVGDSPYYFEWGRPVPRKSVTIRECSIKRSDIKRNRLYLVILYLVRAGTYEFGLHAE